MGEVKNWAVGIAGFLLIMSVVSHLISEKKFFKYIRFFMGLILIVIVLGPGGKFFAIDDIYNNLLNICEDKFNINSIKTEIKTGIGTYTDSVLNVYRQTIIDTVNDIAKKKGMRVEKINADINEDESSDQYGKIKSLNIYLSRDSANKNIKIDKINVGEDSVAAAALPDDSEYSGLKEEISGEFNLEPDNIRIFVSGG